jgi:hypothetical protein
MPAKAPAAAAASASASAMAVSAKAEDPKDPRARTNAATRKMKLIFFITFLLLDG